MKVSARARMREDRAGDPLDGLVNLFDLGIVLAAVPGCALLAHISPARSSGPSPVSSSRARMSPRSSWRPASAPRGRARRSAASTARGRAHDPGRVSAPGLRRSAVGSSSPRLRSGRWPSCSGWPRTSPRTRAARAARSPARRARARVLGRQRRDQLADAVAELEGEMRRRGAHELAHVVHRDAVLGAQALRLLGFGHGAQSTSPRRVDGLDLEQRSMRAWTSTETAASSPIDPAVVVDAADGVLVVAGLDVEQEVLQRRGERVAGGDEQQRAVASRPPRAARRPRRRAGAACWRTRARGRGRRRSSRTSRRRSARTRSRSRPGPGRRCGAPVPSSSSCSSTCSGDRGLRARGRRSSAACAR